MSEITKEYLESLDKRTNIYKEAKKQFDAQNGVTGLGDVVEKITEATGIKKLVKWIAGEDCGCEERKEKLNKLFPLRSKTPNCLMEDDYKWLKNWIAGGKTRMKHNEQVRFIEIYNNVFNTRYTTSNCGDCLISKLHELKVVLEAYETENII